MIIEFAYPQETPKTYKTKKGNKGGVYYITLKKVIETFLSVAENKPVELEMDFSEDNEIHIKGLTH